MKDHAGWSQVALASVTALGRLATLAAQWLGLVVVALAAVATTAGVRRLRPASAARPYGRRLRRDLREPGSSHSSHFCCGREAMKSLWPIVDRRERKRLPPEPRREVLELPARCSRFLDLENCDDLACARRRCWTSAPTSTLTGRLPRCVRRWCASRSTATPIAIAWNCVTAFCHKLLASRPHTHPAGQRGLGVDLAGALAFVRPGDRVLVLGPTFCEYARAAVDGGRYGHNSPGSRRSWFCSRPDQIAGQLKSCIRERLCSLQPKQSHRNDVAFRGHRDLGTPTSRDTIRGGRGVHAFHSTGFGSAARLAGQRMSSCCVR